MMKTKVFWGVFMLLLGVYLIVGQLGYLPEVGVVTILLTGVCIAAFVHGVVHAGFGEMLFSLAILAILYDDWLGITAITPWTVLLAALFGTIGLELIFGKMKKKHRAKSYTNTWQSHWQSHSHHHPVNREKTDQGYDDDERIEDNGEHIEINSKFGSVIRYVTSDNFRCADIDAKFSGITLYLDEAKVSGNATVNIDASFSGIELYVPGAWQVINHMNTTLGGVEEKHKRTGEILVTLTLEGNVTFGGVTVYYV